MNMQVKGAVKRGKREKPPVTLMPTTWDAGAMGLANRKNLISEPATEFDAQTGRATRNPNGVIRYRRKTPIEIYKGELTIEQQAAAHRLYACHQGCPDRDPLARIGEISARGGDPLVTAIDRRREFFGLWARIPMACRPVVERVVLDELCLWPSNPAQRERHMQRLKQGLDAIA